MLRQEGSRYRIEVRSRPDDQPSRLCCTNQVMNSSRESSVIAGWHEQSDTATFRARNLRAYKEALKRRGSLTIWFDPVMTWEAAPTGKRGPPRDYDGAAIQTCLTMKVLFGMALR